MAAESPQFSRIMFKSAEFTSPSPPRITGGQVPGGDTLAPIRADNVEIAGADEPVPVQVTDLILPVALDRRNEDLVVANGHAVPPEAFFRLWVGRLQNPFQGVGFSIIEIRLAHAGARAVQVTAAGSYQELVSRHGDREAKQVARGQETGVADGRSVVPGRPVPPIVVCRAHVGSQSIIVARCPDY